jgi:hypothetical protein
MLDFIAFVINNIENLEGNLMLTHKEIRIKKLVHESRKEG